MSVDTTEERASMEENEIQERLHTVEVAQATGAATLAGAQATQAAAQAGTMAAMAAGGVGLIAGIFIGIAIRSAR